MKQNPKKSKLLYVILVLVHLVIFCKQPEPRALRFMHIYDGLAGPQGKANMAWIHQRLAQFYLHHPGLPVELEQVQWDQIDTKAMADYRAGVSHDLVLISSQLVSRHARVGDLLDLNSVLAWRENQIADFAWNPVWHACDQNGKRYGIPMGSHTRLCVYRTDLFTEAGLDPGNPPQTLDQLVAYAKKLTRDLNGDGKIDIWGLGMYFGPSRATIEVNFAPILWHFGGQLWDGATKQATFASEAGIQAAQFMHDLVHRHQVTPPWAVNGAYDDVIFRGFMDGKLAMAWGWGSYWIQPLEQQGWLEGCFPPTSQCKTGKAGIFVTPTKPQAQFTNAWIISVHATSQRPAASSQLLTIFIDPWALLAFPDAGLPARLSAWQRPEYQTPFYQTWFTAVQKGRSMPPTAHYNELANTIAAALGEILVKNAPVASTLKKFQQAFNKRYAGE